MEREEFSRAVEAFTRCIDDSPESEDAYGNRGVAYLNLGEDELALGDFRKVVALNEDDAMAFAMMSEALKNLGQLEDALHYAAKAIELDPELETAYYVRGWLFMRAGQYALAADDLENFLLYADSPGETEDMLSVCQVLAADNPVDDYDEPMDNPEAIEQYLCESGFSFDFGYNEEYEELQLFCPYAHCIRNLPSRCDDAVGCCPVFGYECPGGEDQTDICRELPPVE